MPLIYEGKLKIVKFYLENEFKKLVLQSQIWEISSAGSVEIKFTGD